MVATFREGGLVAWAEASGQRRTSGGPVGARAAGCGSRFTGGCRRRTGSAKVHRTTRAVSGLDSAQRGLRVPALARWLLDLGIIATLAANVAYGLGHGISAHWWPRAQRLREYLAAAANTHGGSLTA